MFNSISGTISGKFPKQIFIDNNGLEFDIMMPDSNLEMMGNVGDQGRVYTYLQHTDAIMQLFGFASDDERTVFLDLLKVDGIGPKAAIKIMSSVSSGRLMDVLEKGDVEMLEKIPGVGKKTAGKMLLQLKGKLKLRETTTVSVAKPTAYSDVIQSLVSMGYDKRVVEQKVAQLDSMLEADSSFASKTQQEKEEILFSSTFKWSSCNNVSWSSS